ncbi:MAG: rhodanese-like domain-containing protein [Phycisphaerales bacterium]|nr:rhodanese-like domain-containing protein [Phycisphaerales bacterium]
MGTVKQAVIEMVLLGLLSTGLAFGVNSVRKEGHIKPTKNYFDKGVSTATALPANTQRPTGGVASSSPAPKPKHLEHDFQEISLDGVLAVLKDPETARGLNVLIDARKEDDFAEGHLPGAIRCYPYEIEKCINIVLDQARGADKVIVYCGGGDCEDSIFMCRELVSAGLPSEAIYLYPGGWKEWCAHKEPSRNGVEE